MAEAAQENTQTAAPKVEDAPVQQATPAAQEPQKQQQTEAKTEVKEITYDLKLPEGSLLDAKRIEEVAAYARERGFSNDVAQQLLEREHALVQNHVAAQKNNYETVRNGWVSSLKADKEIGGEHWDASVKLAQSAIDRFGGPTFKQALKESGLGDHPDLFRFALAVGKAMAPDNSVVPKSQSVMAEKNLESIFYGGAQS